MKMHIVNGFIHRNRLMCLFLGLELLVVTVRFASLVPRLGTIFPL
jgi:hypothetical protein